MVLSLSKAIEEDPKVKLAGSCALCGREIDVLELRGSVLNDYLNYRYEGGEGCPPCYTGSIKERPMNLAEWWKGT